MPDHRTTAAPAAAPTAGTGVGTTAAALAATLGIAAVAWVVAIRQMDGMDMGPATELGAFGSFAVLWVSMMAAMMLPGAAPAAARHARASGRLLALPLFVGAYLAVWALVGLAAYVVYRPHGSLAAAAAVVAAGAYELTPIKQHFRTRCRRRVGSGLEFGLCCLGSSAGLMLILLALGVMSLAWMSVIAVVILGQKLLPATAAVDVPVALAVVGLGIWIALAPSSVPGLMPLM